ncbi:AAA family ATPase, partial [Streptomyces sp. NPDC059431]|uniref:AAA family ATPase n=1 Tax=Streptomyces sp. NPDC059431 TaxID=3346828 RepID=UPI0036AC1317
ALGAAAAAGAAASPSAGAQAIRHLRGVDAGRAAFLITPQAASGDRPGPVPGQAVAPVGPAGGTPVPGRIAGPLPAQVAGDGDGAVVPARAVGGAGAPGSAPVPGQGVAPGDRAPFPGAEPTGGSRPGEGFPHASPSRAPGSADPGSADPGSAQAADAVATAEREGPGGAAGRGIPAAALVHGDAAVVRSVGWVLRDYAVVGSLEEAEALVAARPDLVAVTAEGDVLGAHLAHGGSAGVPSLIEVQAAVDEADAECGRLDGRCLALEEEKAAAARRRSEAGARVEELGELRRAAEQARAGVAQQLGRLAGQAKGAEGEAERGAAAAAKAQEALEQALADVEECAERLAVAEEMPVEEEPDTSRRDRLAADGANARQTEMEARLQLRTHEERVKGLAGRADGLDRAARAEREARTRAERRRERLRHEARVAGAVADGARQLLAHIEVSLTRAAEERTSAEYAKGLRERELDEARNRGRGLKGELDKLTDSVHRGEVLGAEKRMRIEQVEGRALEEFGIGPAELVAEYGPDQPVPPSPPVEGEDRESDEAGPQPFVRARQEKRLKAAERAYQQLGKVNPLALEEFAALEERHKFLSEQLEDLRKTRTDLLQVVKEVDERVEQVFTEAYRDTAREFEGVFSRLFPGGEGRLILTDPGNMLTTGIDVEARPPGKKVKRLSLLSGGERSLTAVALLVAIFKARPSPFYVMDEVEAALDDTNLQRLIRIMEELQESSQLIVITHQKRTMEVADALYGVSMQGDGVSKVISQRLR